LAVWTRPDQAFLLELGHPCEGLSVASSVSVTSELRTVSAMVDSVIVARTGHQVAAAPCRIEEIRPLDLPSLKQAQDALRQADAVERAASKN
jgi:hypothetical protein